MQHFFGKCPSHWHCTPPHDSRRCFTQVRWVVAAIQDRMLHYLYQHVAHEWLNGFLLCTSECTTLHKCILMHTPKSILSECLQRIQAHRPCYHLARHELTQQIPHNAFKILFPDVVKFEQLVTFQNFPINSLDHFAGHAIWQAARYVLRGCKLLQKKPIAPTACVQQLLLWSFQSRRWHSLEQ